MTTAVKVTPRRSNLIPLIHQSPQHWPRWCYGWQPYWRSPFLLYRRNNRLKIFLFIFLRESERGEAAGIEKKTLHLVFHIQAWPAILKEPLRCGFKRNTLCGTGVGSEPSMEETLQCVAARGASDLACHLKMGAGNGTGTVHFCFFFFCFCFCFGTSFAFVLRGRILVTAHRCLAACLVPPTSCHGFGSTKACVCTRVYCTSSMHPLSL